MSEARPILEVAEVSLRFGGLVALNDVSLKVAVGEIYGIIGPNGAGKTCLLNCINGFYRPSQGVILLEGQNLKGKAPHRITELGIARTFQNVELFREVTVLDNVLMGRHIHLRENVLAAMVFRGPVRAAEIRHRRRVEELLEFLDLGRYRRTLVGRLPYGRQKMVEIARALAMEPKLLLLDEPTSGMSREEKAQIAGYILRIKREMGITQVLIEHDVRIVSELCDRLIVLDSGRRIAEAAPLDVLADPAVIAAYLGGTSERAV
jgi:branched-chain amino acid transport system ATP-binding protein